MKPRNLFLIMIGVTLLGGCATAPLPPAATNVALVREASSAIALNEPELTVSGDTLLLKGSLYRQSGAATTTGSHLDILFCDAAGRILRSEIVRFAPSDLRRLPRQKDRGYYAISIPELPTGTVSIRVRAHELEHS